MHNVYFAPLTPKKQSWFSKWRSRRAKRGGLKKSYTPAAAGEWKHEFEYRKSAARNRKLKKTFVWIVVFVAVVVVWCGLLVWLPYFRVERYVIQGLERVPQKEVNAVMDNLLATRVFLVIPGANYFFFSAARVEKALNEKFPFETIALEKRFPDYVEVTVKEKGRSFIVSNGKEYVYLDARGTVLETARNVRIEEVRTIVEDGATSTVPFPFKDEPLTRYGDIPVLYDASYALIQDSSIDANAAQALRRAHTEIASYMQGFRVHYTFVDPQKPEFVTTYVIREGALIRVQYSLVTSPDEVWPRFGKLWAEAQGNVHSYIDVRFLPRAFYK